MRCSICFCLYTKTNPPFVLNCGHSFHRECLNKAETMVRINNDFLRCSCCRTPVTNITKNYLAEEMLDNDEENVLEELIEKYDEAEELYKKRLKEKENLKKEIKKLNEEKNDIIAFYKSQSILILNQSYIKGANMIHDILNKYQNPFIEQISKIKENKKKIMLELKKESYC